MMDKKTPVEPEILPAEPQTDTGFYETGNTRPPKDHKKIIVFLLVAYLIIGGLGGILTMLNINWAIRRNAPRAMAFSNRAESTEPLTILPTEPVLTAGPGAQLALSETPEAVPNVPQAGGLSLQEIYQKVAPSVVSIAAMGRNGTSAGSGIVMSEDGYLITNCHVVENCYSVQVTLSGGQTYDAVVVGTDSVSDLAVLRIGAKGLTAAEFGNSDQVQVGDSVAAIGNPLGAELSGTMTDGIISAVNRNVRVGGNTLTLLQTTAALNSGNSGGALINCYGQVIGITTAKIGDQYSAAGVEGLGFAIPMSSAKAIVDQLISLGYVPGRASLGLELEEVPALYSLYYKLPGGLWVQEAEQGSDAAKAGISAGDIVTALNGQPVSTAEDVQACLSGASAGDMMTVTFYRGGRYFEVDVALAEAGGR